MSASTQSAMDLSGIECWVRRLYGIKEGRSWTKNQEIKFNVNYFFGGGGEGSGKDRTL